MNLKIMILRINNVVDRVVSRMLPIRPRSSCLVIGHRGAPIASEENTLQGLLMAMELGADGVEMDVICSADNDAFVSHDLDISNWVPAGQRPAVLNQMLSRDIKELRINGSKAPLTLSEALIALESASAKRIYIHYKVGNESGDVRGQIAAIAAAIRNSRTKDRAVVMIESGNVDPWIAYASDISILQCWSEEIPHHWSRRPVGEALARNLSHIGCYYSDFWLSDLGRTLLRAGFPRLGVYFGIGPLRDFIRNSRKPGSSYVIFTINDRFLMAILASIGFDAIGTDDPGQLVGILKG